RRQLGAGGRVRDWGDITPPPLRGSLLSARSGRSFGIAAAVSECPVRVCLVLFVCPIETASVARVKRPLLLEFGVRVRILLGPVRIRALHEELRQFEVVSGARRKSV